MERVKERRGRTEMEEYWVKREKKKRQEMV